MAQRMDSRYFSERLMMTFWAKTTTTTTKQQQNCFISSLVFKPAEGRAVLFDVRCDQSWIRWHRQGLSKKHGHNSTFRSYRNRRTNPRQQRTHNSSLLQHPTCPTETQTITTQGPLTSWCSAEEMRSWVWLNVFNAELAPKVYWRGPKSQGMWRGWGWWWWREGNNT